MTIIGAFLIIFGISVIIFPELIAIIIGIFFYYNGNKCLGVFFPYSASTEKRF